MATLRLTAGGKEFPFPYRLLKILADNYPSGPEAAELGNALLELGIPSITERLVGKEFLTVEQRDALWESGDVDVRRRLLHVEDFISHLTDAQAREIVEQDNVKMLETVAEWAEKLYPARDGAKRLSGASADMLIEHIRTHENIKVREALMENPSVPGRFTPPLPECVKNGCSLAWYIFEDVTMADIRALDGQSREVLVALAENVEDITNPEARKAAVAMLCAHPDPEVRHALVENDSAPRFALELLTQDAEPEIAAIARDKLENG
ncbi:MULTISPECIES: hypothetical protein [unclassified Desulfovibrio]|uniref:hypothetical protein n=1 Tax=unclassified Desulfovibrio TaxID=2593640 RepID=UPI0013EE2083|nr:MULTISPECIES: hypothetical protein [unclassified Desulfovibrio]